MAIVLLIQIHRMPFPVFFANPDMPSRKHVEKEKAVQAVRDYSARQILGGPFIYTTSTVKTEYTTGACHGDQRDLTDFMHWFEKMAPITLPSSSSNSSSNHTAQELALKAHTKSPTEGILDITPCFGSASYPIRTKRTEPGHKEKPHDT